MAYRGLKRLVIFLIVFAGLVTMLQMLAVSRLSTTSRLPWEEGSENGRAGMKNGKRATLKASEHLNAAGDSDYATPPHPDPRNLKQLHDHIVKKMQQDQGISSNATPSERASHSPPSSKAPPPPLAKPVKPSSIPASVPTGTTIPLPPDLVGCKPRSKDTLSAMSRATSKECKDLIRNVSCLGEVGRLYNHYIKHECPLGKYPGRQFSFVPYSQGKGSPIRVVFLLSVHGRSIRQLTRLFKAIYHTSHYYYIHVDSRSDYLHRMVYDFTRELPNVYLPTWRMATIWGGASLLQMLLKALEDLEYVLTEWKWDFFINLSESDYPLKSIDELVQFLRVHRESNFVKTHGGNIKKFVQKQGLDRTFVECDNHMWRVSDRQLPEDITVDGGSDWVVLNRNYSRYLVTSEDPYLVDLKQYYKFSLLPAESFFHTVLRNGPMCASMVKTNLRITNWNRKLGCRCQYKHIVDWCGCSPNDFLSNDFNRLKGAGDHHFFSRKFEAIVNQAVITQLDTHLYGEHPRDTPSLDSYWENVFHADDAEFSATSARFSVYSSFLRISRSAMQNAKVEELKKSESSCVPPDKLAMKEVSVFRERDAFAGLVVTMRDGAVSSMAETEFEAVFNPIPFLKMYSGVKTRIKFLEVGSNWDGKESIFRNYGGILGVSDEPVAAVRLDAGLATEVMLSWVDPVGETASSYKMKLEPGWFVSFHKPKWDRPIRPGVWSVSISTLDGSPIVETRFLVVPLTHHEMTPLVQPQEVNAKRTATQDRPGMDSPGFVEWQEHVNQSGPELEAWLDSLVRQFWHIGGVCMSTPQDNGNKDDACSQVWLKDCRKTEWSTLYPDPKSEIGKVNSNGMIR